MFSTILIRFFDFIISLIFIICFLPFFLIISLLIIIFDVLPIFYISKRVGVYGNAFTMYKFRTMKNKINNNQEDEPTKLGKYLRRSSIDEIPQFFNILKNDMSIVGPRPLPINIEDKIPNELKQIRRLIKPGITGYSQILFGKKKRYWDEKIQQDISYVKNKSFFKYIYIIILTFPTIIKRFRFNNKGRTL